MTEKARRQPAAGRRWLARMNLLTSLILIFPLFLFYQVAVAFVPGAMNGADLVTSGLVALLGRSRGQYLAFQAALLVLFVVAVLLLRRRERLEPRMVLPVLLESGIYAMTMGAVIVQLMHLLGVDPSLGARPAPADGVLARVALSVGAGVHEELVFRLGLLSLLFLLLHRAMDARRWLAIALAFVIGSFLFSIAHQVIGGEPWGVGAVVFRFLAGLLFSAIYWWRGLGVAVYTHALYDIVVLVVR